MGGLDNILDACLRTLPSICAWPLYCPKARDDKTWSFTDCISFEIMCRREIAIALSADRHFRQAGFQTAFVV
jgi:hypothetical protein